MLLSRKERSEIELLRPAIEKRLGEFAAVPQNCWGRELLFCIFTPQSSPYNAEGCIDVLDREGFFEGKMSLKDVTNVLRDPARYVRFHNVKAVRAIKFLQILPQVISILRSGYTPFDERERIWRLIEGYGLKESSHALRNIGRRGLAILDRHILRNLLRMQVIDRIPPTLSPKRYIDIERRFQRFSDKVKVPLDVLDLFFWGREAGAFFK